MNGYYNVEIHNLKKREICENNFILIMVFIYRVPVEIFILFFYSRGIRLIQILILCLQAL